MSTILVTGATGTVGTQLIAALAKREGVTVRAAVRKGDNKKLPANVRTTDFDFEQEATYAPALAGVDKLYVLTPMSDQQVRYGNRLVDAAKAAGVKHIVKQSAIGADIEPGIQLGRWHRAVEKHIEASGIPYTFLRPNNFMQNFIGYYPPGADGNIYLPWGTAACSFVDAQDIGAVAAEVLVNSAKHQGKAYDITGPEAITVAQAAATIAEVTGRKIAYVDVPESAAREAMLGMKMPVWVVDAMMELHAIDKAGYAAGISPAVEQVTGRKPRRFAEFAQQNAAAWRK